MSTVEAEDDGAVDSRVSSTSEAGGGGGGERIVRVGPPAWIVRSEWEEWSRGISVEGG